MKLNLRLQLVLTLTLLSFGSQLIAQSDLFDIVNGLRDEQPDVVISIPPAAKFLNLDVSQEETVKDLIQEQNAELRELFGSRSVGTTDKEFRKQYFDLHRKFEQRFSDLLSPDQNLVFDQYRAVEILRNRLDKKIPGDAAILFFEPIVNALSLSKIQREKLRELSDSFESDVATAKKKSERKCKELATKCQQELRHQLTPKQGAIFEETLGEPFQFKSDFFKELFATTSSFPRQQNGVSVSLETKQPTIGHLLWPASSLSLDASSANLAALSMLNEKTIGDEIDLKASQQEIIEDVFSRLEMALDGTKVTVRFPAISTVETRPTWQTADGEDAIEEFSTLVGNVDISLTKRQQKRLDQLIVQLLIRIRGCAYPLQHPDWIRVLDCTERQKAAFESAKSELLKSIQDDIKSTMVEIDTFRQDFVNRSQEVLADRQRDILRELLGEFPLSPESKTRAVR